jgi:hypothetical protein
VVQGVLGWMKGGSIDGPGGMLLSKGSSTTFDAGDGGKGVLKRRLVARGRFELVSGALYLGSVRVTNTGDMTVNTKSPRGFPAGLLNLDGRPVRITVRRRSEVPPGATTGTPGRPPAATG